VYGNPALMHCWRMVAFAYGDTSLVLMPCGDHVPVADAFIELSNGVRQGDPLAAFLFAVALHPVYEQVAKVCRAGCFAFSDDSHGVGWLEECWRAFEVMPNLLAPLGLRLNPAKCQLTCFHTDDLTHPKDVLALDNFRKAGVMINTEALKVLGCVVGVTDVIIARELRTRPAFCVDQRVAFQRLPLLSTPTAYLALTELTGTVLTNRLRAMSPAATEEHAAQYDREVLRISHSLVGIREVDGDRYDEQLQSAARDCGFGLHPAVRIAPAAYLAGAECTLRSSPVFATVWSGDDGLEPAWPVTVAIDDALRRVAAVEAKFVAACAPQALAGISASVLPTRAATFVEHFKALSPGPIQSAVIHRISTLSNIARMAAARADGVRGRAEVARLQALKAKESSRWLRVLPTDAGLRLRDLQWQTAAQLRLGMPRAPHGDVAPFCSHAAAAASDGWHAIVCQERSSAALTRRHDAVVRLLDDAAHLLKVPSRTEPRDLTVDKKLRPDIQLDFDEYTLLSDVTISHPGAGRWQKVAAVRGVEAVGDARSAEKDGKYTDLAEALDARFSPFVLYSLGGFHKSALSVINQLGAASDPAAALVSLTEWKNDLKDRIAISVQRYTADIVIADDKRARVASIEQRMAAAQTRKFGARHRSSPGVQPLRGSLAGNEFCEVGPRAVSLCAPLFAPSYVVDDPELLSSRSPVSSVLISPEGPFVPDAPAMDDVSVVLAESVHIVSGVPISRARSVPCAREMGAGAGEVIPATPGMDDVHMEACVRGVSDLSVSRLGAEARLRRVAVVAASEVLVARAV
jgi:hypothetical protein